MNKIIEKAGRKSLQQVGEIQTGTQIQEPIGFRKLPLAREVVSTDETSFGEHDNFISVYEKHGLKATTFKNILSGRSRLKGFCGQNEFV